MPGEISHDGIEQVGDDSRDRHRNKNRLEEGHQVTPTQMADPTTITSKTTKIAVSEAHIVLRCQSVGYFLICSETLPRACPC